MYHDIITHIISEFSLHIHEFAFAKCLIDEKQGTTYSTKENNNNHNTSEFQGQSLKVIAFLSEYKAAL